MNVEFRQHLAGVELEVFGNEVAFFQAGVKRGDWRLRLGERGEQSHGLVEEQRLQGHKRFPEWRKKSCMTT